MPLTKTGAQEFFTGFNFLTGDYRFCVLVPGFDATTIPDIDFLNDLSAVEDTEFGRHALTNKTVAMNAAGTKAQCLSPDTYTAAITGTNTVRYCAIFNFAGGADSARKVIQIKNKGVNIDVTDDDMRVSFTGGVVLQIPV